MKKKINLIGREEEIEKLDKMILSNQPEFLAVYGRRRVGKTFLVRQHLKDHIIFDFTGTREGTIEQQLHGFFDEYLKRTRGQKETQPPASWPMAFRYLANYLEGLKRQKFKSVVFIDEMPWIDTPKSDFVPALEFFWNQHVSKMENILLIACGSASSWIKKNLINARGGLYNRVTQRIKLMPFNLHETELFMHNNGVKLTRYQLLEIYMAMGGIPFYLKEVVKGKSSTQLIDDICFSPHGLLYDEYTQLYHSLFKNAEHHIDIIEKLAARPQGITRAEIAAATGMSEGTLSRTLEELAECDFIGFFPPFINKKKDSVYKLTDLYSLFYLKFIKSSKKTGKRTWEQLSVQNSSVAWSGYAFENICMMHIDQIKAALGISGVHIAMNSWKFKGNDTLPGEQIDLIIDRNDQVIHLCEAKFTKGHFAITKSYAAKLRLKKTIFNQVTQTKKSTFTTLLTTYPSLKNSWYLEEIDNEITMDKLFERVK